MAYVFPTRLLKPRTMSARLSGANQSGGRSISGIVQNAELSGGGFWVAEFGDVSLNTREKVLAWRRLAAAATNGARSLVVPLADRRHQPLLNFAYSGADTFGLDTWADDSFWAPESGNVSATLGSGAQRDTFIDFTYGAGLPLLGGEHFSLQTSDLEWRLYRITRVIDQSGGSVTAEIRPPLRRAYANTAMNFDTPRCVMRLDGDMDFSLEQHKYGLASVRFIEDFPPVFPDGADSPGNSPGNSPA